MSDRISLTIDGQQIEASPGQTILEAAEEAGVYIPRLCWMKGLSAFGSFWGNIRRTLVSFRDRQLLSDELS